MEQNEDFKQQEIKSLYEWMITNCGKLGCTLKGIRRYDNGQGKGVYELQFPTPSSVEAVILKIDHGQKIEYNMYPDNPVEILEIMQESIIDIEAPTPPFSIVRLLQDTRLLLGTSVTHIDQLVWRRNHLLFYQDTVSDHHTKERIRQLIEDVTEKLIYVTGENELVKIKTPKQIAAA